MRIMQNNSDFWRQRKIVQFHRETENSERQMKDKHGHVVISAFLPFAVNVILNREVKNRAYGKRQTANVRFTFTFSRKNEHMDENSAK